MTTRTITAHLPPFDAFDAQAAKAKADARAKDNPAPDCIYTISTDELHSMEIRPEVMVKALRLYGFQLPTDATPIMDGDMLLWEWHTHRQEVK